MSRVVVEWSHSEKDFLRDHINKMSVTAIAHKLGRTIQAVKSASKRFGYVESSHFINWSADEDDLLRKLHEKEVQNLL